MTALANFIRQEIDGRGWNQKALADKSGIPKATISRLVNGQVDEPELSTLMRLSDTLNVSLSKLISLAGFPLDLSSSPQQQHARLITLAESFPWLATVMEEIADLSPEDKESVITYLEVLRWRRQGGKG